MVWGVFSILDQELEYSCLRSSLSSRSVLSMSDASSSVSQRDSQPLLVSLDVPGSPFTRIGTSVPSPVRTNPLVSLGTSLSVCPPIPGIDGRIVLLKVVSLKDSFVDVVLLWGCFLRMWWDGDLIGIRFSSRVVMEGGRWTLLWVEKRSERNG